MNKTMFAIGESARFAKASARRAFGGKKIKSVILSILLFAPFLAKAQGWNPGGLTGFGLPSNSIYNIISNFLYWLLAIFGIIAVIGFAIAGIMYIISSGSEDTIKKAKQAMVYSIVGVVVALSGLVVIFAIDSALNAGSGF